MIHAAREELMAAGEKLDRALPAGLLVGLNQAVGVLPGPGLDYGMRDQEPDYAGLKRTHSAPVVEARGGSLFRHCLGPLHDGMVGGMPPDPLHDRDDVDAPLCVLTSHRNVPGFQQERRAVCGLDDGEAAAQPTIYA